MTTEIKHSVRLTDSRFRKVTIAVQDSKAASAIAQWLTTTGGCYRADVQEQHGIGRPFIRSTYRPV